jgi:signal transduction histidine kinase
MSLRIRTLLILTLIIALGTGVAGYFARSWLIDGFRVLEDNDALRNMERYRAALSQSLEDMDRATGDYAFWDDTLSYVKNPNAAYIKANLGIDTIASNRWDFILIANSDGKPIFATAANENRDDIIEPPPELLSLAPLTSKEWHPTEQQGSFKGIINTSHSSYLMVIRRILPSSRKGEGTGTFASFRKLNDREFGKIATLTRLAATMSPAFQDQNTDRRPSINLVSDDTLTIHDNFMDVMNKPAFSVTIEIPRDIAIQGRKSINLVVFGILFIGALLLIAVIFIIETLVLSRLTKLSRDVRHVTASADFHDRVGEFGRDELGQLGHDINDTLKAHESLHLNLRQERERVEKLAADKTIESEKMQTMVRTLSHDLSNHVTVIRGYADHLLKGATDPKIAESLQKIRRATNQQKDVIDMVREMIALRDGKKELSLRPTSLHKCVNECLQNLENMTQRKSIKTHINIDTSIHVAAEKRSLTQQVLSNIISNAIKFSDEGGALRFSARQNANGIELVIEDQGIGMPDAILRDLFDLNAATSRTGTGGEAGTGFGMPVVKFYMAQYKGQVSVESRDRAVHGKDASGTKFILSFTTASMP